MGWHNASKRRRPSRIIVGQRLVCQDIKTAIENIRLKLIVPGLSIEFTVAHPKFLKLLTRKRLYRSQQFFYCFCH